MRSPRARIYTEVERSVAVENNLATDVRGMLEVGEFTQALDDLRSGAANSGAVNALFSATYHELKRMAHERLRRSHPVTTLDTTGLVHESYLRFLKAARLDLEDRSHFMMYAAKVMRSVLVDMARHNAAERRGGNRPRVTLDTSVSDVVASEAELLGIDDALTALERVDATLVRIVEMRYFAGLSVEEVAEQLDSSPRTVFRQWEKARLVLFDALRGI
jgi:RNA polymerase sigma factor (TIGR02999 family)